jgi:hypothetical protein
MIYLMSPNFVKQCLQVMAVMSMWTRLQPVYAANMWNEALNKRLGTEVCRLLLILILPLWVLGIHKIILIQASVRLKQC